MLGECGNSYCFPALCCNSLNSLGCHEPWFRSCGSWLNNAECLVNVSLRTAALGGEEVVTQALLSKSHKATELGNVKFLYFSMKEQCARQSSLCVSQRQNWNGQGTEQNSNQACPDRFLLSRYAAIAADSRGNSPWLQQLRPMLTRAKQLIKL